MPDDFTGRSEAVDLEAWDAWDPWKVDQMLAGLDAPWCVAGGWAIDLFVGEVTREHGDLEIIVPRGRFAELVAHLPDHRLYAVGDGRVWPIDAADGATESHRQTWVLDPVSGRWRLDVMRDLHDGDTWICQRDESLRRPYAAIIERSADGVPYLRPEWVLLFKAKEPRGKDEADLAVVLPRLSEDDRGWLARTIARVYDAGHPWIPRVSAVAPRDRRP